MIVQSLKDDDDINIAFESIRNSGLLVTIKMFGDVNLMFGDATSAEIQEYLRANHPEMADPPPTSQKAVDKRQLKRDLAVHGVCAVDAGGNVVDPSTLRLARPHISEGLEKRGGAHVYQL